MESTPGTSASVKIGTVIIGQGYPCAVQTMWKEALSGDPQQYVDRMERLRRIGCAIVRFAVPDMGTAEYLGDLASRTTMPLVADIHFDWRIALRCLDFPFAKIRINPGNIGASWKLKEVAGKAGDKRVPIRIGVNSGSLPKDLDAMEDRALAMVMAAERELSAFDEVGFSDLVVSLKSSNVDETIRANTAFAEKHQIPLHLGLTEAGPLLPGLVRSTAAIFGLLQRGIGATIRVSLSDSMEHETLAGSEIVALVSGRRCNPSIISCPKCGRSGFDTHEFLGRWKDRIYALEKPLTIAIMGCGVNGPGEARHADLGITGSAGKVVIFSHGKIIRTVPADEADTVFEEELSVLCEK